MQSQKKKDTFLSWFQSEEEKIYMTLAIFILPENNKEQNRR